MTQSKPKKMSYLSRQSNSKKTKSFLPRHKTRKLSKVRLISQDKLTITKNLSAIALLPQVVILVIIFVALYLKLKRPIFNKVWIDVLCIASLIPISYGINFGSMVMFESLAASYSSSNGSSDDSSNGSSNGSSDAVLVGSASCSQDDDGNTVCSDGTNSVNLGSMAQPLTNITTAGTITVVQ